MGEVYKAEDLKLEQTVALKFLPDSLAMHPGTLARFHAEVRLARQVSHPFVCRVSDVGEVDGLQFLTMEFIDGEDLASLLRRIGRLPPDKAIEISRQLCGALAAAHDAGIVHRDLKPANARLRVDSWLTSPAAQGEIQVSIDGETWHTVAVVAPSESWTPIAVELDADPGARIVVRFVLHGALTDTWWLKGLAIDTR